MAVVGCWKDPKGFEYWRWIGWSVVGYRCIGEVEVAGQFVYWVLPYCVPEREEVKVCHFGRLYHGL